MNILISQNGLGKVDDQISDTLVQDVIYYNSLPQTAPL